MQLTRLLLQEGFVCLSLFTTDVWTFCRGGVSPCRSEHMFFFLQDTALILKFEATILLSKGCR